MVYACDRPRSEQSGFKPWSRKLRCDTPGCELHCDETSSFFAVQVSFMVHLRK